MSDVAPFLECRYCRTRQRVELDTDGGGHLVESLACRCDERRRVGICLDCPEPVEGRLGVALRCADCKRKARAEYSKRYRERHPDRIREVYDRENAKRRTVIGRARVRIREREYRSRPELRARRCDRCRAIGVKHPEHKRGQHRRYKLKYPERVRDQQNRANAKRREERLEYMHLYCTKYVGEGKKPICRQCGNEVEWAGIGRPRLDCEACREGS